MTPESRRSSTQPSKTGKRRSTEWPKLGAAEAEAAEPPDVEPVAPAVEAVAAGGGGGGASDIAPNVAVRPSLNDVPDYFPPFKLGASRADADGNIWILTTAIVNRRPVYDIVNRRGELFDRVQLPEFRTIAGFGPGVVYMAVKDSTGVVHVERARVK